MSIKEKDGNEILTREKLVLHKVEESYITADISLEAATYILTEFIVTDANNVVISISPKKGSVLAQFVSNPLAFDFVVSPNETKETTAENLNASGYTSVDFGYTGLSLIFLRNTCLLYTSPSPRD